MRSRDSVPVWAGRMSSWLIGSRWVMACHGTVGGVDESRHHRDTQWRTARLTPLDERCRIGPIGFVAVGMVTVLATG
jgi:hypothetical protein